MSFLTIFLIGMIGGLLLSIFAPAYLSKKGELLATKDDLEKIAKEIRELKILQEENFNLPEAEKEFFNENKIY